MTDLLARLTAALADRYHIELELGAVGMATVYLAHDEKHRRKVAGHHPRVADRVPPIDGFLDRTLGPVQMRQQ